MKLRCLAIFLGLALASAAAKAQVAMYFMPTGASVRTSTTDTGTFAFLGDGVKSRIFKGAVFGVYYDFPSSGSLKVGVDMRDRIIGSTNGARANSFLVGLRAVYSNQSRLQPYAEAVVGVAGTHSGTNPLWLKRAEFGGLAGVDYRLGRHADWRALELGYTAFTPMNSNAFGTPGAQPTVSALSFASGLVIRF